MPLVDRLWCSCIVSDDGCCVIVVLALLFLVVVVVVVAAAGVAMFDVIRNGDNSAVVIVTAVISSADIRQLLLSLLRCFIISLPSMYSVDKRISSVENVKEKQSKPRLAV
jgi:hypothetical protein